MVGSISYCQGASSKLYDFLPALANSETLKKENEWLQLAGRVGHAGAARQLEHAHLCTASKNASTEDDRKISKKSEEDRPKKRFFISSPLLSETLPKAQRSRGLSSYH